MAQITKTVIFPVPTEFYGDTQDTNRSGICTYTGPDSITVWYRNIGTAEVPNWVVEHYFATDPGEDRDPPVECNVVVLNANTHPMNAIAMWGGIAEPDLIETPAGPASEPNPIISDYLHFNEVYDMRSFEYNFTNNSWDTGVFSGPHTELELPENDSTAFGWDIVRATRNALLEACDNKIPNDAPAGFASEWTAYRQKLRDLPATWDNVGNNTYLIVWPREPGDVSSFVGKSPETGLDSTDTTTVGE